MFLKFKYKRFILLILFVFMTGFLSLYIWEFQQLKIQEYVIQSCEKIYLPSIWYYRKPVVRTSVMEKIYKVVLNSQPILHFIQNMNVDSQAIEDRQTLAMIVEKQKSNTNLEPQQIKDPKSEQIKEKIQETNPEEPSVEQLRDFNYLLSHYYIVDSCTATNSSQINYDEFMSHDMKINQSSGGPKVLIYHTHSQEAFIDSIPGDPNTSIVGVGRYLTELLNAKGISTIHDESVYDVIEGKLDRSMAYEYSNSGATRILAENPTIEVVIDLHRDGVSDDVRLVSEWNGKTAAKIMFFNGLSYTSSNGPIDYLYNPYLKENLSFSFQMQYACEKKYPGWARRIYLQAYRYNLELMPKSLLIEAGAQTNTVEEMNNAMELLADVLYYVLVG